MPEPLRILIVEDSVDDAHLLLLELSRGGLNPDWRRVETADEMRAALAEGPWDVVLADYTLPGFGATDALALCREADPVLPFVVVSGSVGEDMAVGMMRSGVNDYVLKHNLVRLSATVQREVREAENRRARRRAEQSASLFAAVVESSEEAVVCTDSGGVILSWNPAAERLFGYAAGEAVGSSNFLLVVPPDLLPEARDRVERLHRGERLAPLETVRLRKGGGTVHVAMTVSAVRVDGRVIALAAVYRDITARHEAEAARKRADEAVRSSEARFRALVEKSYDGVVLLDATGTIRYASPPAGRIGGRPPEGYVGRKISEFEHPEEAHAHAARVQELIRHPGGSFTGESRLRHADGSWRWIESTFSNLLEDAAVGAVVVNFRDVTERKQAEAKLRRAGDLLRAVADGTTDAVFVKDRAGRYLLANPAAAGFMGRPMEDILGRDDTEFFEPEGARRVVENDRRVMESGEVVTWEERLTSGGMTRTYLATKGPYRDENDRVIGIIGVSRDITDAKLAEDALRASEERFRSFMDHSPAAAWISDADGRLLYVSAAYRRVFFLPPGEVIGRSAFDLLPHDIAQVYCDNIREVARSGRVLETTEPGIRPDGTPGAFIVYKFPLRRADGVTEIGGVGVDVTERRQAEAERSDLLARLNLQVERLPLAYLLSGPDFNYTHWNPAAERMFGFAAAEVLGKHPSEVIVPPQSGAVVAGIFARLAAGDMEAHGVWENVTRDGRTITCEWYNTPLLGPDGTFLGVLSLAQDITERRRAEEEVRRNERLLRQVLDALPTGVMVTDRAGDVLLSNLALERIWGRMIGDGAARRAASKGWWHGTGTPIAPGEWASARAADGHTSVNQLVDIEAFDGVRKVIKNSASPIRDDELAVTGVVIIIEDVTEVLRLEEQFRQAQKMDAFGQLAGGVAHDFNNLLTVINGYSDLLIQGLPPGDRSSEFLREIRRAGEQSAALTRQLLAFSRKQIVCPKVLDLNAIVADAEKMLRRVIGEDVQLVTSLAGGLGSVRADAGQLEQVLMNLVLNARDAMPQGGRLTVATRNVELGEGHARARAGVPPGAYVLLAVTDTGCGMTAEVKGRLFEPFFTTKEVGKGTGLGLAVVHGVIEQAGGHVGVTSAVGVGSTFEVFLPRVDQPAQPGKSRSELQALPRGTETVLLVEDDDGVRFLARRMVERLGYTVLEASGGADALRVARGHAGPVDLLITDVVMPGLSGQQVAEALARLHPETRVLFVSGYTDDAVVRHGVLQDEVHFLSKPFSSLALACKVRAVLDTPAPCRA